MSDNQPQEPKFDKPTLREMASATEKLQDGLNLVIQRGNFVTDLSQSPILDEFEGTYESIEFVISTETPERLELITNTAIVALTPKLVVDREKAIDEINKRQFTYVDLKVQVILTPWNNDYLSRIKKDSGVLRTIKVPAIIAINKIIDTALDVKDFDTNRNRFRHREPGSYTEVPQESGSKIKVFDLVARIKFK